jgi:hypothetical protein
MHALVQAHSSFNCCMGNRVVGCHAASHHVRCVSEHGVPVTVTKSVIPLGCLINMDGTAIFFLIVVVFLEIWAD